MGGPGGKWAAWLLFKGCVALWAVGSWVGEAHPTQLERQGICQLLGDWVVLGGLILDDKDHWPLVQVNELVTVLNIHPCCYETIPDWLLEMDQGKGSRSWIVAMSGQ